MGSRDSRRDGKRGAARWCGPLVFGIGVAHIAYGVVFGQELWADVAREGVFGSALLDDPARSAWFWFTLAGVPMLIVGQLTAWAVRRTGELPRFLAWWLAAFAALVLAIPASGFWLFVPVTVLAFVASRRGKASEGPEGSEDAERAELGTPTTSVG